MKRRKIAILLASTMILSNFSEVLALNNNHQTKYESSIENQLSLEEGSYTIENNVLKSDSDQESTARKYIDKVSNIVVKEGKMYISFKFLEKDVIKNITFKMGTEVIEPKVINEDSKVVEYEIEIGNMNEVILVNADIQTPIFPKPMNVNFRILLKIDTLTGVDVELPSIPSEPVEPENPEVPQEPEVPVTPEEPKDEGSNEEDNIIDKDTSNDNTQEPSEEDKNQSSNAYKDGFYKMKNKIVTNSEIGYQAARQSLNETNYMEVKNGKTYITLGFGQTNLMSNVRVLVNNKTVNYTVVKKDSNNHTMDIKFEVPSLASKLTIKAYIPMIEQDISFGVDFVKSSIAEINSSESSKTLGTTSSSSAMDEIMNLSSSELNELNEEEKENVEKEVQAPEESNYTKRYSIKNEVVHDSNIGRKMARKYLNETSYIEEDENGDKYAIITLSGSSVMENIKIKVNGEEVQYTVTNAGEGVKSFRFKIETITDKIQVYMFIKPVKMNIDFEIKLLEDTLTLIDEKELEVIQATQLSEVSTNKDVNVLQIVIITAIITSIINTAVLVIAYKIYKLKKIKNK